MSVFEVPVDWSLGAVYSWTLRLTTQTLTGHVVLRGGGAAQIGNYNYAQGTETWYYAPPTSSGNESQTFSMTLQIMKPGQSEELIAAVDAVNEGETDFGVMNVAPTWVAGAPLPENPTVFTLTNVDGGTGSYGSLYEKVSLIMPISEEAPLLPTFYTSDKTLTSILGNNPPNVGVTPQFSQVAAGKKGYPTSGWYWYGRDPS